MSERKLASVRVIDAIDPIPGADAIDVATIGGWKVVVKKGEFNPGDMCVYFEIDSWIPKDVAPFLFKGRSYNGVEGERLRTVKLRGQISQGLVLPMTVVASYSPRDCNWYIMHHDDYLLDGDDLTEFLMIQKYEKPLPGSLAGKVRGNFPSFIRKTDQERIQNLKKQLAFWVFGGLRWEVTEKLDGSSMTVYHNDGLFSVCSRNLDLAMPDEGVHNSFWEVALRHKLNERMVDFGRNIAIQGELVGPGVQGNKYGLSHTDFYVFDVWDIDNQCYVSPSERLCIVEHFGLKNVPVIARDLEINPFNSVSENITELLAYAEGKSVIGNKSEREGLVFKSDCGGKSFKVISNKWLLKNED